VQGVGATRRAARAVAPAHNGLCTGVRLAPPAIAGHVGKGGPAAHLVELGDEFGQHVGDERGLAQELGHADEGHVVGLPWLAQAPAHVCVCVCVCMCMRACACLHPCVRACLHACVCVWICVRVCGGKVSGS